MGNKRVAFCTLGCRVNQYETRALEEAFQKEGFDVCAFEEDCDVYVVNSCTVTAESDRKSRQMIRRARKLGTQRAVVIATGCMVQVCGEDISEIEELDFACGTRNKMLIVSKAIALLKQKEKKAEVVITDFEKKKDIEQMSISKSDTTRAFVKISDGCNNNCSYCIIPKARGPVCSKKAEDVCSEVRTLCSNGWHEVVLTGIETASYGRDLKEDLPGLIEKVAALEVPLYRIRLGSMEPAYMKQEVVSRLAKIKKLMPHYHLSLQSGSDRVLALMKRKYNTESFFLLVQSLKEKIEDVTVTTDIIVGFPGETEEMFEETCEFVKRCGLLYAHIFPYSDRKGTVASAMKNKVPEEIKRLRAAKLKKVMLEGRKAVIEGYIGKTREVLVEKVEKGIATGHTDNFIETRFRVKDTAVQKNDLVFVRFDDISKDCEYVEGTIVNGCK